MASGSPDSPDSKLNASSIQTVAGRPKLIAAFIFVTLVVLFADLAFKSWSFKHVAGEPVVLDPDRPNRPNIPPHDPVIVIPNILSLRLLTNTGAVFGVWKGAKSFFVIISIIATAVIFYVFYKSDANARVMHLALAMILAGTLGNLYDRIQFSAVRDMLWLFPGVKLPFGLSWPGGATDIYPWLFNIADAALVIGVFLMIIMMYKAQPPGQAEQSNPD